MDGFSALWRAVLVTALADAARGDTGWIGSLDFRMTCSLAGVDADAALRAFATGCAAWSWDGGADAVRSGHFLWRNPHIARGRLKGGPPV